MIDAPNVRRVARMLLALGGLLGLLAVPRPTSLAAQTIHAVLFHSPYCPHCRRVISEDLPIFYQVYGGAPRVIQGAPHLALVTNGELEILFVDASQPAGGELYQASLESHPVTEDRQGVPRLVIGDSVLVGELEIPSRLHGIIRAGLAAGGIPWPEIPGLADALATVTRTDTAGTADTAGATGATADTAQQANDTGRAVSTLEVRDDTAAAASDTSPALRLEDLAAERHASVGDRLRRDPVGNGLAIVVLVVMVSVVVAAFAGLPRRWGPRTSGLWIPALTVVGGAVAGYLAWVETSGVKAVCGPVGDCNTVQQSPYAELFGIPVGVLGLVGFGAVLVLWVLGQEGRASPGRARDWLFGLTMAGTLFSAYLTFLEPFVIGATCAWCLTSALVMTALLWLAAAWSQVDAGR